MENLLMFIQATLCVGAAFAVIGVLYLALRFVVELVLTGLELIAAHSALGLYLLDKWYKED